MENAGNPPATENVGRFVRADYDWGLTNDGNIELDTPRI